MISDLIIRVRYEGSTYDLDVLNEVPLRVDMSTVEVGELGRVFGIGSQTFTLPGTKKNNKFFKNAYDIAADNPPGMYNSIDGWVIQNGETLLYGQFQLMEVVTDEDGFVNYNVQISDKVIQFNEELKGKYIKDGDWSAYTHTLTSGSIVDSWSGNLLSGSVFYPLAEYGRPEDQQRGIPYPYLGFDNEGAMGNGIYPLEAQQFLPAIKVKDALDVIFDQVGFRATGSFLEKPEFNNLYMLTKANDNFGPVIPSASATFAGYGNSINELVFLGSTGSRVPIQVESFDPQNAFDTSTYLYTSLSTGTHSFNGSISFFNPCTGGQSARITLTLFKGDPATARTVLSQVQQDFSAGSGFGPFTLSVSDTNDVSSGDNAWLEVAYTALSGTPVSLVLLGGFYRQFRCTQAPTVYEGVTVDMADQFNPELKSEDIIKGLITQFNLVMIPDQSDQSTIQIETFDDWIRAGEFKDWNDKYDTSQRVSITHTINELPKQVILTQAEDNDRLSKITKEQEPYRQYGSLELFATSNNAIGEDKLETVFAPIILGGVYDATTYESSSFDIDTSSTVVYPHLYKYENDKILPYGFKPRLGFRVNNNLPSGSQIAIGTPQGGGSVKCIKISGSYGTLSNLSQLPGVPGSTIDLHFNNTYTDFGSSALGFNDGVDSFNTYWKTYYDSLYWDDAKKITLSAKFDPYEYKNIKLNDKILIKNQYYRINKIKGFNVTYRDVVEVELIRLYPAYFQYVPQGGVIPTPSAGTPTPSPTISVTPSITVTPTISVTSGLSVTPSVSPSLTPSISVTPSTSTTPSLSVTPSITTSITPTPSTTTPLYYRFENCDTLELVFQSNVPPGIQVNDRYSDGVTNFIYDGTTTTLPGTIVTNLTYVGTTGCVDPPPSPSPVIQTFKAQITNCGGSTTWFVEFLNYSSLPNNFAIESSQINLDGQCWEIIDNEYPGPADFQANIDNYYSSCGSCVPPTPTPTPSPSTVFYSFSTVYSAVSELAACEVVSPTVTVYSTCSTITVGCRLYDSTSIFDYAADGWYHDINNGNYYYVEGNGYVAETGVCSAPSPTPTPSPSTAPCTALLMQEIGSATSSAACSGASATSTRGHNGLSTYPIIGDTVYARDTCAATFNGQNLWYFVDGDTSAILINGSGEVVDRVDC